MKLTPNQVAKKILAAAIETSIDWIQEYIDNDFQKSEIKEQRQLLKGMERVHLKLEIQELKN